MTTSKQKSLEKYQLDMILNKHAGWIPGVDQVEIGDPQRGQPDFLILRGDRGPLGIEHTSLKQKTKVMGFEQAEIEATRLKICEMASAIYLRSNGVPVCVNAAIGVGPYLKFHKIAEYFAHQVAANINSSQCVSLWPSMGSPVELHFSVWAAGDAKPQWNLVGVGETQLLTINEMQDAVSKKLDKVNVYRNHCEEIWLLVVSAMFPSSSNFVLPKDASAWRINHAFDKVYLYCQETNELLMF